MAVYIKSYINAKSSLHTYNKTYQIQLINLLKQFSSVPKGMAILDIKHIHSLNNLKKSVSK